MPIDSVPQLTPESTSIKFPDFKQSGVSLRSQRVRLSIFITLVGDACSTSGGCYYNTWFLQMKLPASVGQKKSKAIEQVLDELGLGEQISTILAIWLPAH